MTGRFRNVAFDREGPRMPAGCLLRSGRRGGRGALRHARGEDRPVLHHAHGRAHPRHRSPEGDGDAAHGRADHRGRSACRGAGESRGPGFRAAGGHARPGGPDRRLQPVRGRPRQEGVLPAAADGPGGRLRLRLGGDVRERRRGGRAGGHERVPAEARALLARPVSSTRVFPSRRSAMLTLLVALAAAAAHAQAKTPRGLEGLDSLYPELDALYLDMHRNPELSGHEEKTAAKLAERLRRLGYEVTTGVGGTGVVGVLRNGTGPTVLLRTELDALPVEEKTGLPYASKATATDPAGKTVPVMHACGHDIHMASWAGVAMLLARNKDRWRGTVVMIGQPAEETVQGAKAMIADGLFSRFPKPNFAVAVHDKSDLPAGKVTFIPGYALANVDSVDVTLFGRGGHGAKPETTVDPIVMAARTILALQGLVSREKDPLEPAVVTVGSIQGGFKHNIIPDQVHLQITVRSYTPEVRKQLLDGIARIAKGEAALSQAPREPEVRFSEPANATYNDPVLTRRLAAMLSRELGQDNIAEGKPEMIAEDFGEFGRAAGVPSVMLRVGAAEPARYAQAMQKGEPLPSLHSSTFAPDRERTIRTGASVLTLSALELLGKPVETH